MRPIPLLRASAPLLSKLLMTQLLTVMGGGSVAVASPEGTAGSGTPCPDDARPYEGQREGERLSACVLPDGKGRSP